MIDAARLQVLIRLWRDRADAARRPPAVRTTVDEALLAGVIVAANTTMARTCDHCADELERAIAEASS